MRIKQLGRLMHNTVLLAVVLSPWVAAGLLLGPLAKWMGLPEIPNNQFGLLLTVGLLSCFSAVGVLLASLLVLETRF